MSLRNRKNKSSDWFIELVSLYFAEEAELLESTWKTLIISWAIVGVGSLTVGCQQVIHMDPLVFQASEKDGTIKVHTMDPEALFKEGRVAFRSRQYKESAYIFETFLKQFPDDERAHSARYNAGLSRERLEQWDEAVLHFETYVQFARDPRDEIDGRFRLVMSRKGQGNWDGMWTDVERLLGLQLTVLDRAEAIALSGFAQERRGDLALAERAYMKALSVETTQEDPELFKTNEHLAMAQYQIGEIYRSLFSAIVFRLPVERMQRDLHDKSTLFLKAQSAYLKAIRRQNKSWALAAGFRTGEIYASFYEDFLNAEVPDELETDEVQIYFDELRGQVRPLLERAIRVYERNIKMGARSRQGDNPWVEKTRVHLQKLKEILAEELEREREKEMEEAEESPAS